MVIIPGSGALFKCFFPFGLSSTFLGGEPKKTKSRNLYKLAEVSIIRLLLYSHNVFMRMMQLEVVWERVLMTMNYIIMPMSWHWKSTLFIQKQQIFFFWIVSNTEWFFNWILKASFWNLCLPILECPDASHVLISFFFPSIAACNINYILINQKNSSLAWRKFIVCL